MTTKRSCAALLVLVLVTACSRADTAASDSAAMNTASANRATSAAAIANAIAANPAKADSILKANNTTAEEFERLMYDIAADSAQSAAYAAATRN